MSKDNVKKKKTKKEIRKAAAAGAAGLAATSMLIGSVFSNPAEVMEKVQDDNTRPVIVAQMEANLDEQVPEEPEENDEKKRGLREMFKRFLQNLPLPAKLLFVLPMWVIGYGLLALLTALFEPVIAPVLGIIIKWLLVGLLLAAGLFCIKKAVAPDTPLREIFSKRNVILLAVTAAVLGAGDYFAKIYIDNYTIWRNIACFSAGLLILLFFTLRTLQKKKRKEVEAAA